MTYLKGQGAYSGNDYNIMYVTLNPTEVREVKRILAGLDPDAFISIIDVDEVISSDFKIRRKILISLLKRLYRRNLSC